MLAGTYSQPDTCPAHTAADSIQKKHLIVDNVPNTEVKIPSWAIRLFVVAQVAVAYTSICKAALLQPTLIHAMLQAECLDNTGRSIQAALAHMLHSAGSDIPHILAALGQLALVMPQNVGASTGQQLPCVSVSNLPVQPCMHHLLQHQQPPPHGICTDPHSRQCRRLHHLSLLYRMGCKSADSWQLGTESTVCIGMLLSGPASWLQLLALVRPQLAAAVLLCMSLFQS